MKGDGKIKSRFGCSQLDIEDNTVCGDGRNPTGKCEFDSCPRKTGKPPTISYVMNDDDEFLSVNE